MALTDAQATLLGAGLGVGSSLISTGANAIMSKKTRQWQEKQNEIERQRQDTAWQRTVKDMQMAGLNPALANGGAETAGANLTPVSPADMSGIADGINNVLNRYQQKKLAEKDYEYKVSKLESDKSIAEAAAIQAKANAEEQVRHNMEQERLTGISQSETERHNKRSEEIQETNGNYLNKLINTLTLGEEGNKVKNIIKDEVKSWSEYYEKGESFREKAKEKIKEIVQEYRDRKSKKIHENGVSGKF